ncbi:Glycosyltransferase involved in cell wall bisynthesis [Algibacter lectus]|uniref:glycosyltransferase n=1 Tax=Algibacter lectus TaxID=221126 RepID=UPI0008E63D52|nr:glycosyltransferase [Algibacter lectus]SFD29960.1 Glycosyltransferase involved in cell wall bisynthesis [Algibacter lectus]
MNILFISNNFPPILDGVGDYTYKLTQNLVSQGFEVSVLCSEKREIINSKEKFSLEDITVLPIVKTWDSKGLKEVKNVFKDKTYDYISLQYVPFAFNKKGLPIHLGRNLKNIFPNANCHIMFHELWVAMEIGASFKSKIHGYIQKNLIKGLIKTLKPALINTHCNLYKHQINQLGYSATILPLFSNMLKSQQIAPHIESHKKTNTIVLSIFGSIHYGAPVSLFLDELLQVTQNDSNKFAKIKFIFIGNCGLHIEEWTRALRNRDIEFEITGKLSEHDISNYLSITDIGITTTPYVLVEKSGTVAAMMQHDLNVICVARDWNVEACKINHSTNLIGVKNYQNGTLEKIMNTPNTLVYNDVLNVSKQLIRELNKDK